MGGQLFPTPGLSQKRQKGGGTQGQAAPLLKREGQDPAPAALDRGCYNEVIRVRDRDAFDMGREVVRREGILVGISSGAALWAAGQLALREEFSGKTIAVILPDSGDRYLSSPMFS